MENIYMSRGADKVVNTCMKVRPGEQILIVTELSRLSIAQALASEVYRAGAEPAVCIMEPRKRDGEEPPKEIAAAMLASDGFISVVGKSITHTEAVKSAIGAGSRGLVLTHFTEEMMIHGGIEGDFEKLKPLCINMAEAMAGAKKIVLTSPGGTHLEYSAEGRRGNHLYCMVEKGQFSTLPTVEANVSPVEGSANGIIVADGSIPYIGIGVLEEPVTLRVENDADKSLRGNARPWNVARRPHRNRDSGWHHIRGRTEKKVRKSKLQRRPPQSPQKRSPRPARDPRGLPEPPLYHRRKM